MKFPRYLMALLLIFTVFFSGCNIKSIIDTGPIGEAIKDIIKCNPPYIQKGFQCCLDQNQNNICDEDEPTKPQCTKNSDCGKDGFVGDLYCIPMSMVCNSSLSKLCDLNYKGVVVQDYIVHMCIQPGTKVAHCEEKIEKRPKEYCKYGCDGTSCAEKPSDKEENNREEENNYSKTPPTNTTQKDIPKTPPYPINILKKGEGFKFTICEDIYKIQLEDVSNDTSLISITIPKKDEIMYLLLKINDPKEIDLDSDKNPDIKITLLKVKQDSIEFVLEIYPKICGKCEKDSDCEVIFDSCTCSYKCYPRGQPRVACLNVCPNKNETKPPTCKCINNECIGVYTIGVIPLPSQPVTTTIPNETSGGGSGGGNYTQATSPSTSEPAGGGGAATTSNFSY